MQGYTKKDGTYVAPHTRSAPNAYRYDNNGSQSSGGSKRDEYSPQPATNSTNASYKSYDNDGDGVSNSSDRYPESSKRQ